MAGYKLNAPTRTVRNSSAAYRAVIHERSTSAARILFFIDFSILSARFIYNLSSGLPFLTRHPTDMKDNLQKRPYYSCAIESICV